MKLAVLGATGGTGKEIVRIALAQGDEVRILARTPAKVETKNERLTVVQGDAFKEIDVQTVIRGCDVVLSALGSGSFLQQARKTTFYSETAKCLVKAMRKEGMKRLVAITSSGVEENPGASLPFKLFVRKLLMPTYLDMKKMEDIIEAENGLQYTFVRPSYLTSGKSKPYRVNDRTSPSRGSMISRRDVAKFMVGEAKEGKWIGRHPALAM